VIQLRFEYKEMEAMNTRHRFDFSHYSAESDSHLHRIEETGAV
jgi:hypothetical protein